MKRGALHLSFAALLAASGCASAGRAIGGPGLEREVLARAGPTKLAAALATDLMNRPANDPLRLSPQMAGLRGLLDAPAPPATIAAQAQPRGAFAAPLAALSPVSLEAIYAPASLTAGPALALPAAPAARPAAFAVALGRFDDPAIAGAVWGELAAADPLAVKSLTPHLVTDKTGVSLLAGPLADEDTARGRCTAFAALGVECAPTPLRGKPLAGAGA